MKLSSFFASFILCLTLLACSKKDNSTTPPPTPAAVSIENFAFEAASLTVKAGTVVTWTNHDATAHTVTADDGSYNSGNLAKDATFSFTYKTAGTYTYHCTYHPMMTGTVVVQ